MKENETRDNSFLGNVLVFLIKFAIVAVVFWILLKLLHNHQFTEMELAGWGALISVVIDYVIEKVVPKVAPNGDKTRRYLDWR